MEWVKEKYPNRFIKDEVDQGYILVNQEDIPEKLRGYKLTLSADKNYDDMVRYLAYHTMGAPTPMDWELYWAYNDDIANRENELYLPLITA